MSMRNLMHSVGLRSPAKLTALSVVKTHATPEPVLSKSPIAVHKRRRLPFRPGLLTYKRGMVPWFDENGKSYPCTVLEVDRVQVTNVRSDPEKGFYSVQLGSGSVKYTNTTRQLLGHFAKAQVAPKKDVAEFQVRDETGLLPLGTELRADHFVEGQYVDLRSTTRGKGFMGVMQRWGFAGLPASHGVSVAHRSAGSTGQNQDPGRVVPGKKMAGNVGNEYNTIQNAKIVKIYPEKGLILVKGGVSGSKGKLVKIWDAKRKSFPQELRDKWLEFYNSHRKA